VAVGGPATSAACAPYARVSMQVNAVSGRTRRMLENMVKTTSVYGV
jgi:hypothetical protein